MNKIEISLQNLFESDVSLEKVGLKTGVSTVTLDEYRRGLKSWRKMPLDVALRLADYWNSREDVLSKYQRVGFDESVAADSGVQENVPGCKVRLL